MTPYTTFDNNSNLYLDTSLKKYKAANRKGKSAILNQVCEASGYHKKHAIHLLNQRKVRLKPDRKRRGRPPKKIHVLLIHAQSMLG